MSNRKKPDARALFKQAKKQHVGSGGGGTGSAGAVGAAISSKYKGKSKEELVAILKLKKAQANKAKSQEAKPPRQRPDVVRSPAVGAKPSVPTANPQQGPVVPATKRSTVAQTGNALTSLLGIGADGSSDGSSSDEDDDGEKTTTTNNGVVAAPSAVKPAPKPSVPEGLPAGFFDDELPAEPEAATVEFSDIVSLDNDRGEDGGVSLSGSANGKQDKNLAPAPARSRGRLDPARAAELVAEAAAQEAADELRVREVAARAVAATRAARPTAGGVETGKEVGKSEDADAAAAPNGSALPEGFFDDPEVDAKSRGVDLKAKKIEEEQNEWKDFMTFAEEVKKTEKKEEEKEEEQHEDKEQYEELEQATMMGRLAMLMNKSESIGRKRKRPVDSSGGIDEEEKQVDRKTGSIQEEADDVELSVAKAGSAMREVAVASAPADAAAVEISSMLKSKKRNKKKEVEEAFAGDYVPMDPLDWRAKGR